LHVALARLVDLKAALLAETSARAALTDRACARRNWHGACATSSVDGWASMALRLDVVEAAGARSSEAGEGWFEHATRIPDPPGPPPVHTIPARPNRSLKRLGCKKPFEATPLGPA
jgi:hypothetical protein